MPGNFDAIAPWYHWLERLAFGGSLHRCRTALLDQIPEIRHALIIGEGNGRFLEALRLRKPELEITVVEASQEMIKLARRRAGQTGKVHFIHGDVREASLVLPETDLLVTCFVLDCFEELELKRVMERLQRRLHQPGLWLWADFAIPDSQPMNAVAHGVIALLYRFFRIASGIKAARLPDAHAQFLNHGFKEHASRSFLAGLLATTLYQAHR